MSTAVMPSQLDIGETAFQNRRNSNSACRVYEAGYGGDRREWQMACATTTTTTYFAVARHRNLSGPCSTGARPTLDNRALATPPPGVPGSRADREPTRERDHHHGPHRSTKEGSSSTSNNSSSSGNRHGAHRKLDRSLSDSEDRLNGNNGRGVNSSRYKTELCRPFEESGHCKYGDKCQFAHGANELRNLTRHPKYKTERCRTYHTIGFCPYGPRCHFIHNEDETLIIQRKNSSSAARQAGQKPCQFILPSSSNSSQMANRPSNLSGLNSLGSSFESVSSSSSPGNLSPSHMDEPFPPIGTFSPSAVNECLLEGGQDCSEPVPPTPSSSIFTFPASDAAGILTPLNIQTQQMYNNMMDMAALARFSNALNLSQNQNNGSSYTSPSAATTTNLNSSQSRQNQNPVDPLVADTWSFRGETGDIGVAFPPPSNSPQSLLSEDSMGSNGSLELSCIGSGALDNAVHLVNSPHDLGRSLRLPIFNKFSSDSES